MTNHLRTTLTCASLLVVFSGAALGQHYPTTDNGQTPFRLAADANGASAFARFSPGSGHALYRLPATNPSEPLAYVASAHHGGSYDGTPVPLEGNCSTCQEYTCACGPHWVISADVLWMSRGGAISQTMIQSPLGGLVVSESFNARELVFDARAGFQVGWGYDLLDGRAVELSAMSVYDQPAFANVADTNMFFSFHGLSPAIATDAYTVDYVSNLHSGELNWWLGEAWGIRPMIGARWLRIREEFSILDTTDTSWDAFSSMTNDLIGAQLGFKTRLWNGGDWCRVEATMKSGIYHNDVDYQAFVVDAAGSSQGGITRSPSATSYAGELTVSAVVQLCPRLAMRIGYRGLWMSDIALAPNQANQSDITTGLGTDHLGSLNYQGGFFGLEGNW